jgi:hypothetical protein
MLRTDYIRWRISFLLWLNRALPLFWALRLVRAAYTPPGSIPVLWLAPVSG